MRSGPRRWCGLSGLPPALSHPPPPEGARRRGRRSFCSFGLTPLAADLSESSETLKAPETPGPSTLADDKIDSKTLAPNSRAPRGAIHQGVYRPYIPDSAALAPPTYEELSLASPHEWFCTRKTQRKVFLHVGPTNSGKTHAALQALRACKEGTLGLFCAPLRLLAWQVSQDLKCSLLTGQEREEVADSNVTACTVEMCDIVTEYSVAVVDEIQLVGDPDRGATFTRALLGLHAEELHLCGEAGTIGLVKEICKLTGDSLEIRQYERLSPLKMEPKPIGSLQNVREGDCVVVFSRKAVSRVQREILRETGQKTAVVYGSLPPETRKLQANLFNSGERKIIVATDAIGMGLNLAIKRVVFFEVSKFDGKEQRPLYDREIRQVGGRAGRYGHGNDDGKVTTLRKSDHAQVTAAISAADPTIITHAMTFPPREFLRARFHNTLIELLQRDIRLLPEFVKRRYSEGDVPSEAAADWLALKIHDAYAQVVGEVEKARLGKENRSSDKKKSPYALAQSSESAEKLDLLRSLRLGIANIQALSEAPFSIRSERGKDAFLKYAKQHQVGALGLLHECFMDPFYLELFGPFFERYGCILEEAPDDPKKLPKVALAPISESSAKSVKVVAQRVQALEEVYMVLDLSLWLGIRFGHPDEELIAIQKLKDKCNEYIVRGLAIANTKKENPKKKKKPKKHFPKQRFSNPQRSA